MHGEWGDDINMISLAICFKNDGVNVEIPNFYIFNY